jgi:hypothetical protein
MENQEEQNKPKVAVSEHYDPENPQNQNVPKYNSTTDRREGAGVPAIENLNHQDGLADDLKEATNEDSDESMTKNDASLFGKPGQTDLGAGQRDEDEDEDEKIIRR